MQESMQNGYSLAKSFRANVTLLAQMIGIGVALWAPLIAIMIWMSGNFTDLRSDNADLEKAFTAQIQALDDKLSRQIQALDDKLSRQIQELDDKLSGQIQALDDKLSGQIQELDDKLSGQIQELDDRLSGQIQAQDDRLSGQIQAQDDRLSGLIQALDDRLSGQIQELDDRIVAIDNKINAIGEMTVFAFSDGEISSEELAAIWSRATSSN